MTLEKMKRIGRKSIDFSQVFNMVAIITKGGNILSIGNNQQNTTHPVYFNGKYSLGIHAEYDALRQVRHQDLSNAVMYVFYFRKDGEMGNSMPCEDCRKQIAKAGISKVFYIEEGECKRM